MARIGKADRELSGHYLSAVAAVTVVVAGLAWYSQNRTLAAAAAALGLYGLHLLSIRFLLENQKRQRQVLDAQWEVLQRFISNTDSETGDTEDIIPAMPVDREAPERLESTLVVRAVTPTSSAAGETEPDFRADPPLASETPEAAGGGRRPTAESVVLGDLVPPAESLGATEPGFALVTEEDSIEPLLVIPELQPDDEVSPPADGPERDDDARRPKGAEVPVPRHFALGTVALVRDLLTPAEVARVLLEQRRQPGKKFGGLAVEMGLLSDSQREELLLAQQEGLFTDAEMRDARHRLREFRETAAHSMVGLD
jgi:hypothetical protein